MSRLWRDAADATWQDSSLCVEGSRNAVTAPRQLGTRPNRQHKGGQTITLEDGIDSTIPDGEVPWIEPWPRCEPDGSCRLVDFNCIQAVAHTLFGKLMEGPLCLRKCSIEDGIVSSFIPCAGNCIPDSDPTIVGYQTTQTGRRVPKIIQRGYCFPEEERDIGKENKYLLEEEQRRENWPTKGQDPAAEELGRRPTEQNSPNLRPASISSGTAGMCGPKKLRRRWALMPGPRGGAGDQLVGTQGRNPGSHGPQNFNFANIPDKTPADSEAKTPADSEAEPPGAEPAQTDKESGNGREAPEGDKSDSTEKTVEQYNVCT